MPPSRALPLGYWTKDIVQNSAFVRFCVCAFLQCVGEVSRGGEVPPPGLTTSFDRRQPNLGQLLAGQYR